MKESDGRTHEVHARSVVDASGRTAIFARSQGARRIHHGDLIAIVGWLDAEVTRRLGRLQCSRSNPARGWWSLSGGADETLVATLYDQLANDQDRGCDNEMWWAHALGKSRSIARTLRQADATLTQTAVYPAFPSRLSQLVGDGWIAVGDAAVAFDPIAGQGVAMAIDAAFRAFEAATVDPSWGRLGSGLSRRADRPTRQAHEGPGACVRRGRGSSCRAIRALRSSLDG